MLEEFSHSLPSGLVTDIECYPRNSNVHGSWHARFPEWSYITTVNTNTSTLPLIKVSQMPEVSTPNLGDSAEGSPELGGSIHSFTAFASARSSTCAPNSIPTDSDRMEVSDGRESNHLYIVGFTITAAPHKPPPPFATHYNTAMPKAVPNWKGISKTEIALLDHRWTGRLSRTLQGRSLSSPSLEPSVVVAHSW